MKCVNQRYYINNTMYNWKKEKEEKEKKRRKKILGRRKSNIVTEVLPLTKGKSYILC